MGDKEKHLCKMKDLVKEDFKAFKRLVTEPRFACSKCGRVAREEKYLCKPVSLDS